MKTLALLTVWLAFAATPTTKNPDDVPHHDSKMLTVAIHHAGIDVLQVLDKKGLRTRLPQHWPTFDHRWQLLDERGAVLVEGAFDPGRLCLDPAHAGWQPHVTGDEVVPHVGHANVKVPDLGARARRVAFLRREAPNADWRTVATHPLPSAPEKR